MCERRAKSLNKELPDKFWILPEWQKFFVYQVSLVNKLIKEHGRLVTLSAIVKKLHKRIWSLRHPAVILAIEASKKEVWVEGQGDHPTIEIVDASGVGRVYKSRTIVDILDELET